LSVNEYLRTRERSDRYITRLVTLLNFFEPLVAINAESRTI